MSKIKTIYKLCTNFIYFADDSNAFLDAKFGNVKNVIALPGVTSQVFNKATQFNSVGDIEFTGQGNYVYLAKFKGDVYVADSGEAIVSTICNLKKKAQGWEFDVEYISDWQEVAEEYAEEQWGQWEAVSFPFHNGEGSYTFTLIQNSKETRDLYYGTESEASDLDEINELHEMFAADDAPTSAEAFAQELRPWQEAYEAKKEQWGEVWADLYPYFEKLDEARAHFATATPEEKKAMLDAACEPVEPKTAGDTYIITHGCSLEPNNFPTFHNSNTVLSVWNSDGSQSIVGRNTRNRTLEQNEFLLVFEYPTQAFGGGTVKEITGEYPNWIYNCLPEHYEDEYVYFVVVNGYCYVHPSIVDLMERIELTNRHLVRGFKVKPYGCYED
jgi:hypothetical protein